MAFNPKMLQFDSRLERGDGFRNEPSVTEVQGTGLGAACAEDRTLMTLCKVPVRGGSLRMTGIMSPIRYRVRVAADIPGPLQVR